MIERLSYKLLPLDEPSEKKIALKCAAVLLPLVIDKQTNQWHILFTRRAAHLKHHPGQISFPGGRFETQDFNLSTTAIRETHEETGIEPKLIQLLGRLPQQQTTSQYNITPFVGTIDSHYQLKIDHNEVAEVFTVPFEFVTNLSQQKKVTKTISGVEYSFYVIQYKHYNIWGTTASILVNLSRRLGSNFKVLSP